MAAGMALGANAQEVWGEPKVSVFQPGPAAPPTPPPMLMQPEEEAGKLRAQGQGAGALHSIGDPSPEEQLYLEYINRARAEPKQEAQRFRLTTDPLVLRDYENWSVNLDLMVSQFGTIIAAPPLAMNAKLMAAARRHTLDMFNNVFQGHTGSDGSQFNNRIAAEGYVIAAGAENVFSYAGSVFHGHAGYEVDWGPGVGGMQTPPGHRNNIHNASFREAGIGVVNGRNEKAGAKPVGPQLVTQEFGTAQGATPFITGVAYYDLNGNSFYDAGEGIGGVSVAVTGVALGAVTARSGGYAVPVPGNGSYTVTFSGAGFTADARSVTVAQLQNRKLDFTPVYSPPVVSGSATPALNRPNQYAISAVPGAAAYQWRVYQKITAAGEGAETGTSRVEIEQTEGYEVFEASVRRTGAYSFHLAHPQAGPRSQSITLRPNFQAGAGASVVFASRLGWAAADQKALVQVSTNQGAEWTTVFSQAGTNGRGETSFTIRTVNLAAYAGLPLRLRFVYEFLSGSYFDGTEPSVGWLIDDISFTGLQEITGEQISNAAGPGFAYTPATAGSHELQARARAGHDFLDWGPAWAVSPAEGTGAAELRITGWSVAGGQAAIEFELVSGAKPASLRLETRPALASGAWVTEAVNAETLSESRFRFSVPAAAGAKARFFRIQGQ